MTDNIWTHTCLIVSASSVHLDIFNSFKWWRRRCLSSSERTSVSLTGRKQRRKGDGVGGGWAGGGYRRGDTQRLTASIMRVQQSAAWPSSWSSERSIYVFACVRVCVVLDMFVFERACASCPPMNMPALQSVCVCTIVGDVCVCARERDTSQGVAGVSFGPQMRPLTDGSSLWPSLPQFILSPSPRLQAHFHFDGQYVLLPRITRLLYN